MSIQDVIDQEGGPAVVIESHLSVEDAIDLMTEKDLSAVIVIEGNRPVGIFTERDVLLSYARSGKRPFKEIEMRSAMTNKLIVARPEDDIDATLSLMIQTGIRHIPVIDGGEIVSLISICDLAHHQVGTLSTELHYLEEYVNDLHEAGRD